LCDLGPLGSALARPQHLAAYEPDADAPRLAATYAYGLARNHPFVDGSKRTALIVLELFSNLNGHRFDADDADCVATMLALAAGALSEEELAAWVAQHAHPASKDDAGAG
jgi:death-on-curing protein